MAIAIDRDGATAEDVGRTEASVRESGLDPVVEVEHLDVEALLEAGATHLLWVSAGTVLARTAVAEVGEAIRRFPATALLYADAPDSRRPDFAPVLLRSLDYLGAVRIFSLAALRDVGPPVGGARTVDMWRAALRIARAGLEVLHLPAALAVTESAPVRGSADESAEMIGSELAELGLDARVDGIDGASVAIEYLLGRLPQVSIIIPTRGSAAEVWGERRVLVVEAVRSIVDRSTYDEVQFVVVADDDTPRRVLDELAEIAGDRLTVVPWTEAFNFSAKMNRGAAHATGEYLLLLNDDIEVITPDWIERMLVLAVQPGVGLVGAYLHFEDGTLQHAGHVYRRGEPTHAAIGWAADRSDPIGSIRFDREVSGVTAACAMLSAETYRAVGGMTTLLPGNYNDVDLCMKVRERRLRTVITPAARLHHFESKTRDATVTEPELALVRARWGAWLEREAYWVGAGV